MVILHYNYLSYNSCDGDLEVSQGWILYIVPGVVVPVELECGRMSDLISREALYEAISYALYSSIRLDVSDIRDIINNQPAAYDVDNVDGQMEACRWVKGLHSFETCWSDVSIKDYKKYAMRFCPKCGKKIKVV